MTVAAEQLKVQEARNPVVAELKRGVAPEKVLDIIERAREQGGSAPRQRFLSYLPLTAAVALPPRLLFTVMFTGLVATVNLPV